MNRFLIEHLNESKTGLGSGKRTDVMEGCHCFSRSCEISFFRGWEFSTGTSQLVLDHWEVRGDLGLREGMLNFGMDFPVFG